MPKTTFKAMIERTLSMARRSREAYQQAIEEIKAALDAPTMQVAASGSPVHLADALARAGRMKTVAELYGDALAILEGANTDPERRRACLESLMVARQQARRKAVSLLEDLAPGRPTTPGHEAERQYVLFWGAVTGAGAYFESTIGEGVDCSDPPAA